MDTMKYRKLQFSKLGPGESMYRPAIKIIQSDCTDTNWMPINKAELEAIRNILCKS